MSRVSEAGSGERAGPIVRVPGRRVPKPPGRIHQLRCAPRIRRPFRSHEVYEPARLRSGCHYGGHQPGPGGRREVPLVQEPHVIPHHQGVPVRREGQRRRPARELPRQVVAALGPLRRSKKRPAGLPDEEIQSPVCTGADRHHPIPGLHPVHGRRSLPLRQELDVFLLLNGKGDDPPLAFKRDGKRHPRSADPAVGKAQGDGAPLGLIAGRGDARRGRPAPLPHGLGPLRQGHLLQQLARAGVEQLDHPVLPQEKQPFLKLIDAGRMDGPARREGTVLDQSARGQRNDARPLHPGGLEQRDDFLHEEPGDQGDGAHRDHCPQPGQASSQPVEEEAARPALGQRPGGVRTCGNSRQRVAQPWGPHASFTFRV